MKARPYQELTIAGIHEQWQSSNSTLAVLATGLGKTVIAAYVIADRVQHGRCLFLAHREELIWQACDKIYRVTGIKPVVEMADYRADMPMFDKSPIVVSTVQTQYAGAKGEGRMAGFDPREFATLIVDEAHHYVAPAFRRVVDYYRQNPTLKVLGITATPDRADEVAMGKIFETVAYEYGIREGIEDGWLTPIEQQMVTVDGLDLSNIRTVGGDLNGAELAEVMERESNLHEIADPTMKLIGDRRALGFCASVAHAEMLSEICNRHRPDCSQWVCGTTPKDIRRRMFADYASHRFQILWNVGVATEGFDDPGVEIIVQARPTKSRSLYAQMIGRGDRPLPGVVDPYEHADDRRIAIAESDKTHCLVIDFVGNSGKHKLITTADILGGNYDDEVIAHATARAKEAGKSVDMLDALKESLAEVHAQKEAAKAAEAARRARLRVAANYSTQQVDPFDVFQIEPHREMGWDTGKPITEKMRNLLDKQGIDTSEMHYGQAKQLLNELFRRWDAKEASFKQAKLLRRYGLPGDVGRDQAKEWIDKIAGNNWKLPPDIAPQRPASTIRPAPVEIF